MATKKTVPARRPPRARARAPEKSPTYTVEELSELAEKTSAFIDELNTHYADALTEIREILEFGRHTAEIQSKVIRKFLDVGALVAEAVADLQGRVAALEKATLGKAKKQPPLDKAMAELRKLSATLDSATKLAVTYYDGEE